MLLTSKEREKLHRAIVAYLRAQSLDEAAETVAAAAGLSGDMGDGSLLEKKWSSVVRLQQKVLNLQNEVEQLKEEMVFYGPGKKLGDSNTKRVEGLPRVPAKFCLNGHRESVTALSFHPVYSILASASEDGSVRLWDYESGVFERTLKGHTATVNSLAFEPGTGKLLATASADLSIKLWMFESFECVKTLNGHEHTVSEVRFVPAGDHLVSCSRDKTLKLWEVASGFCIRTFTGHSEWVRCLTLNTAGNLIVSGSHDETVMVWAIDNPSALSVLTGHSNVVECVEFASAAALQEISSADYIPQAAESAEEISGSRSREMLVSGSRDKTIMLWDIWKATCLVVLRGHDNWVRGLLFHPSGRYLYSCADDKTIRIWDCKTARAAKVLVDAHDHFVTCIALNPRYPLLASGSVDKAVRVWECR
jgi:platelet-activating factor acetylhydrolase IB subunit alpha